MMMAALRDELRETEKTLRELQATKIKLLSEIKEEDERSKECCDWGTHLCEIPMPINGQVCGVDRCIVDLVAALNAGGLVTLDSCCGHGKTSGVIFLQDGRKLTIGTFERSQSRATQNPHSTGVRQ